MKAYTESERQAAVKRYKPRGNRPELTQERLKEVLNYNPETGAFTWISSSDKNKRVGMRAGWECEQGYIKIEVDRRTYGAHRLAFFYMTGRWPIVADHKNRIRNDNRWINIREATKAQNCQNIEPRATNTSGYRNVFWSNKSRKWFVRLNCNNKTKTFGFYDDIELAGLVAEEARIKYHGEFAS